MRNFVAMCVTCFVLLSPLTVSAEEPSVERGLYLSIIGGCHDCHTEGYSESEGVIDPEKALKGSVIGRQGPWGTTYPTNLRYFVANTPLKEFHIAVRNTDFRPPMPDYNLRKMTDDDLNSLYLYVQSLGEPGERAPEFVAPGDRVNTPFIVLAPPQMPPPCTRDLDCGVGEICGTAEPRSCVKR